MKASISDLISWVPLKQQIERYYPFEFNDLKAFEDIIDFSNISLNRNLSWDTKVLDEFSHRLEWSKLSSNPSVKWNNLLVEKYKNYIDWTSATSNKNFPWTKMMFHKYKDSINWESINDLPVRYSVDDITFLTKEQRKYLGRFKNVDWDGYMIERFKDDFDWELILRNPSIPFSEYFFKTYKDNFHFIQIITHPWLLRDENLSFLDQIAYVDFNLLSEWKEDWTIEFIINHEDELNWDLLSANQNLPWSMDFLLKYEDKWNWNAMSGNRNVPWTWQLIEKHEVEWCWQEDSDPFLSLYRTMSTNPSLPWSKEFVNTFGHHMEFGGVKQLGEDEFTFVFGISSNTKIDWDIDFLLTYKDKWDVDALEKNEAVYSAIAKNAGKNEIVNLLKVIF